MSRMDIKLNKFNCCDFSKVDSIGVMCRGRSLGSIGEYKKHFKNIFIVGQHVRSLSLIGKYVKGANMVRVWGSTYDKPSVEVKAMYKEYNIRDIQTYLAPTVSDRKAHKFKKLFKRFSDLAQVFPLPLNFHQRNKRFILKRKYRDRERLHHPTLGLYGVDLACAYKPISIHIIGLDFYTVPDFVAEKNHINIAKNAPRCHGMIEYFKLLCKEESDIQFYLYTCCKTIKSEGNLKVIRV